MEKTSPEAEIHAAGFFALYEAALAQLKTVGETAGYIHGTQEPNEKLDDTINWISMTTLNIEWGREAQLPKYRGFVDMTNEAIRDAHEKIDRDAPEWKEFLKTDKKNPWVQEAEQINPANAMAQVQADFIFHQTTETLQGCFRQAIDMIVPKCVGIARAVYNLPPEQCMEYFERRTEGEPLNLPELKRKASDNLRKSIQSIHEKIEEKHKAREELQRKFNGISKDAIDYILLDMQIEELCKRLNIAKRELLLLETPDEKNPAVAATDREMNPYPLTIIEALIPAPEAKPAGDSLAKPDENEPVPISADARTEEPWNSSETPAGPQKAADSGSAREPYHSDISKTAIGEKTINVERSRFSPAIGLGSPIVLKFDVMSCTAIIIFDPVKKAFKGYHADRFTPETIRFVIKEFENSGFDIQKSKYLIVGDSPMTENAFKALLPENNYQDYLHKDYLENRNKVMQCLHDQIGIGRENVKYLLTPIAAILPYTSHKVRVDCQAGDTYVYRIESGVEMLLDIVNVRDGSETNPTPVSGTTPELSPAASDREMKPSPLAIKSIQKKVKEELDRRLKMKGFSYEEIKSRALKRTGRTSPRLIKMIRHYLPDGITYKLFNTFLNLKELELFFKSNPAFAGDRAFELLRPNICYATRLRNLPHNLYYAIIDAILQFVYGANPEHRIFLSDDSKDPEYYEFHWAWVLGLSYKGGNQALEVLAGELERVKNECFKPNEDFKRNYHWSAAYQEILLEGIYLAKTYSKGEKEYKRTILENALNAKSFHVTDLARHLLKVGLWRERQSSKDYKVLFTYGFAYPASAHHDYTRAVLIDKKPFFKENKSATPQDVVPADAAAAEGACVINGASPESAAPRDAWINGASLESATLRDVSGGPTQPNDEMLKDVGGRSGVNRVRFASGWTGSENAAKPAGDNLAKPDKNELVPIFATATSTATPAELLRAIRDGETRDGGSLLAQTLGEGGFRPLDASEAALCERLVEAGVLERVEDRGGEGIDRGRNKGEGKGVDKGEEVRYRLAPVMMGTGAAGKVDAGDAISAGDTRNRINVAIDVMSDEDRKRGVNRGEKGKIGESEEGKIGEKTLREPQGISPEILRAHIVDYAWTRIKEVAMSKKDADAPKKVYDIKVWGGYAGLSQKSLLTKIRNLTQGKQYRVSFGEIGELVSFARDNVNDSVVTILPLNDETRSLADKGAEARVVYINPDGDIKTDDLGQLQGIIGIGKAYLNDDEESFYRLYGLLAENPVDDYVELSELKSNPVLFIDKLRFILRPIAAHDYNARVRLIRCQETLLENA
ncbi:MAG: hypothetical protein Q7S07_01695 [Candidatus Omnitrophota bacterium]|nr:hypothetical protein [Candidatus Omnitrophota bacterium]